MGLDYQYINPPPPSPTVTKVKHELNNVTQCHVCRLPLLTKRTFMNSPRLDSGCLVHRSAARVMLNVIHPSVLAYAVTLVTGSRILSLQRHKQITLTNKYLTLPDDRYTVKPVYNDMLWKIKTVSP